MQKGDFMRTTAFGDKIEAANYENVKVSLQQ
jgi:hypothetical protein